MGRKTDKTVYQEVVATTDGEVVTHKTLYMTKDEPPYVKVYIDCVLMIKGLPKGLSNILLELLKHMTFADNTVQGGQVIALNAYLKRQIANNLGVSVKRVEQGITEFVKKDIMKRIAVGTYQVNPNMFGKGEWGDIKKIRDIYATIDFKKREIVAEIVNEEEESVNEHTEKLEDEYKEKMRGANNDTTRKDRQSVQNEPDSLLSSEGNRSQA